MPATFTRTPIDVERKDTGIGGKPPFDHRPTGGGGDGENWDNGRGDHGPRETLSRYRMGLFFALAGDMMFFVALVSAFFARQSSGHVGPGNAWVSDWHGLALPPILWIDTAILLLSSVTMEVARRQLFHENDVMDEWLGLGRPTARRAAPWLIATASLGILFLAGQFVAWRQLLAQGIYFSSTPNSHFFYLITGTHVLHLLIGVFALGFCLLSLLMLHKLEMRQVIVDCTAWYWHTMGVFWIFLFVLLEFCQ